MVSLFSSDSALTIGHVFDSASALTSEFIASLGAGDTWLDSGTGTTMLDAHSTDGSGGRWIGSGNDHLQSPSDTANRGREIEAMLNSQNWWVGSGGPYSTRKQVTKSQLDSIGKFASPYTGKCDIKKGWRGLETPAPDGKLPEHLRLIWENALPDKGRGDIEAEMREVDRRSAVRLFDRSGSSR